MRRLVVSEFVSLDGVAEAPDRFPTEWDDDVMDARMAEAIATQDTVLLGRRTFDEWVGFWPGSTIEPYGSFINAVTKLVATSSPLEQAWTNTDVVEGDLVEAVRTLKEQPGGDIGVQGSLSVAHTLLAAGLVDQLNLVIIPVVAGSGRRLLEGLPLQQLEPLRSQTTPTGKLLADYRLSPRKSRAPGSISPD